jgi:hypothetical protein
MKGEQVCWGWRLKEEIEDDVEFERKVKGGN